jgi:hypothetical protein
MIPSDMKLGEPFKRDPCKLKNQVVVIQVIPSNTKFDEPF